MKDEDYSQNIDKQAKVRDLERQIDQMVYRLYDLTPEKIAIVEGKMEPTGQNYLEKVKGYMIRL